MCKRLFLFLLTIIAVGGIQSVAKAQDPHFSQFYANPLYLNPAFAGSEVCGRATLNYRDQWPGLSGHFVTTTASYDQYVKALYGGVGLQVLRDDAGEGTLSLTRVALSYAYTFNITREFAIKFGGEAAYFQRSLDWSQLTFGDMIDPRKGFIYETKDSQRGGKAADMDFSAGMLGYSRNFYFGFAVHHLFEPNESVILGDSPAPRKYTAHIGAKINLSDTRYNIQNKSYISPNILYMRQGQFEELFAGLYMQKGPILGGVWYRNKDSFILLLGVEYNKFKFGYSYDITVSKLTTQSGGSHEISAGYKFPCKQPKRQFRTISCPSF